MRGEAQPNGSHQRPHADLSARGRGALTGHQAQSPAAEHFMRPGALHVFVRRHDHGTKVNVWV